MAPKLGDGSSVKFVELFLDPQLLVAASFVDSAFGSFTVDDFFTGVGGLFLGG